MMPADPAPPRRRAGRPPAPAVPAAVWLLALLCALPELALWGADWGLWGSARWRPLAYAQGAFWAGLWHGWGPNYAAQPWVMAVTYAWLHTGPGHLLGNLAALLWLGPGVVARHGTRGLAAIWIAATLGGAAAFGLLTASPLPMVGASGALFGLAADWLLAEVRALPGRRARSLRASALLALLLALNAAGWVLQGGHLAWQTHLGGFVAGGGLALLWHRRRRRGA